MSKLVERLRELSNSDGLQFEAADRIEHLERVLVQARSAMEYQTKHTSGFFIDTHAAVAAIDETLKEQG